MKKVLRFLLAFLVLLLLIITVKTITFQSKQSDITGKHRKFEIDANALNHLRSAIQIKTISFDNNSLTDYSTFDSLIAFLKVTYPLSFEHLSPRIINEHSLLFHWKGKDNNKKPVILYSHMDVVPVESDSQWTHPPFDGFKDDAFVYGRGAIDDKGSIISILESVEKMLKKDFIPIRDIYIAFGHDEEATGLKGAKKIAEVLESENVKAEFLLDEGGLVAIDIVPFVKQPVALVFTAEKGYMTLELSVKNSGGHSSHPTKDSPIEILANAIRNIQTHPFKKRITTPVEDFFDYAGPEMNFPFNVLFANRWLFKPIILSEYEKISTANATIRTTSVATVISGGEKENVIPAFVHAKLNFRLLPGDSSSAVFEKVKSIVNDERVAISIIGIVDEPSGMSSSETEGFNLLRQSIQKTFPDAVIAPSLLIAQTDSRHFRKVTENIYRFLPLRMDDKILDGMHGIDEKIGINDFMEMISFYEDLFGKL